MSKWSSIPANIRTENVVNAAESATMRARWTATVTAPAAKRWWEAFEIHGTRYTSLENALAAAQNGDTITLRGPLTIENADPIEISKNITLDLNGFTLSKSAENALLCILGSNVAIINGKVQNTYPNKPHKAVEVGKLNHTGAKLTLDKVTLEGSIDGGTGARGRGLFIYTGNEAVVTSGTFTGGIYTEGTLTMSGGQRGISWNWVRSRVFK